MLSKRNHDLKSTRNKSNIRNLKSIVSETFITRGNLGWVGREEGGEGKGG
jgi:hypothetical protein